MYSVIVRIFGNEAPANCGRWYGLCRTFGYLIWKSLGCKVVVFSDHPAKEKMQKIWAQLIMLQLEKISNGLGNMKINLI